MHARVREVFRMTNYDRWSGRETCAVLVSWVFSLGLWFVLGVLTGCATSSEEARRSQVLCFKFFGVKALFWPIFSVICVMYLVNAVFSPVRMYLSNQLDEPCKAYIERLLKTPPLLWWHIQCYHYETRTRTVTDSEGHTHTETYQERVDTHSATGAYDFGSWRDMSSNMSIPMSPNLLRLRFDKEYRFADEETKADYDGSYARWVAANDLDTYKDVSEGFDVEGFLSYVLSRNRHTHAPCNCFISSPWYYISTLLALNVLYVHFFFCMTMPFDVQLVKEVSCRSNALNTADIDFTSVYERQQPIPVIPACSGETAESIRKMVSDVPHSPPPRLPPPPRSASSCERYAVYDTNEPFSGISEAAVEPPMEPLYSSDAGRRFHSPCPRPAVAKK